MALMSQETLKTIYGLYGAASLGGDIVGVPAALGVAAWNKFNPDNKKSVRGTYIAGGLIGAVGGLAMSRFMPGRMGSLTKTLMTASVGASIVGDTAAVGTFFYNRFHPRNKKSIIKANLYGTAVGAAGGAAIGAILASKMVRGIRF